MRALESGMQLREYRLEHRIGRGGEGDVWYATHLRGQAVAVKARPHTDDGDAQRFRAEFARLRTLRIPGIVRVVDVGADQGYLFFAMEVAEGVPFDQFVAAIPSEKQRVEQVCAASAQVARTLASIHRLGLAHRDIKPANIHVKVHLVETDLEVVVLDFGTHHFGHSAEDTGALRGTPAYMAPEQRLGMPHDHRVDIHSLGTVLHEAISGQRASSVPPGQRRPSLVGRGPHIPLALAHLVDRMLDLDPSERPSAEEAEAVLQGIAFRHALHPVPWPKPVFVGSDVQDLMKQSRWLYGELGDGVARHIATTRWHWYRKGYLSVMGRCEPTRPYGPWVSIFSQLFGQRSAQQRTELAGSDVQVIHGIWPEFAQPCEDPMTFAPDPTQAAAAIVSVLNRCAPIAVIIHDMHHADPGTVQTISLVQAGLDERNRLWVTSHKPSDDLEVTTTPPWNEEAHHSSWQELLGTRVAMPPMAQNGQDFLRMAWDALAEERNEPPLLYPSPISLQRLAVLRQPFPQSVAVQVAPDLDNWIERGQLLVETQATEGASALLRFASEANRTLARAQLENEAEAHELAAVAWGRFPEADAAVIARVRHLLLADTATTEDLMAVVQLEVINEHPRQVRRWLNLLRLHVGAEEFQEIMEVFEAQYAQLYAQLHIAPNTIDRDDIRQMAVDADDPRRRGLVAHFKLAHAIRMGGDKTIVEQGRRWASSMAVRYPVLAARMYRELALSSLGTRNNAAAIRDSRSALVLSRKGAESIIVSEEHTDLETTASGPPKRLTQPEIDAATTYSAALVYASKPVEAEKLCQTMYHRCHRTGRHRGSAAFLINRAIALHRVGRRKEAGDALAEARALQHLHGDGHVFANHAVIAARLAVERADLAAAQLLLDEAITASVGVDDADLLGEAWTCVLDLANQTGNINEARRALSTYGTNSAWSARDHWPAALARWHWARGQADQALAATEETRQGYGGACILAERARLLLISGQRDQSIECANALLRHPVGMEFSELHLFAKLVRGAARLEDDRRYAKRLEPTRDSRWVHLYLGALHLDAIRRRSRGENVMPLLRNLAARSVDLGHRMYEALANPKGW